MAILAIAASSAGLFVGSLYRDPIAISPAMRGQDIVTLAVAPFVWMAVLQATRGSARAHVLALGLTGYMAYTYAGAAFGYRFNPLLLVYIAVLSGSAALLLLLSRQVDDIAIQPLVGRSVRRRVVAGFLLAVAVLLCLLELGEIARYLITGVLPASVARAGGMTFFPYVLDLGFVVPLSVLAAILLWRARPVGDILAAVLLVKAATMGAALVSMNVVSTLSGVGDDGLTPFYAFLAVGAVTLSFWFLRGAMPSPRSN